MVFIIDPSVEIHTQRFLRHPVAKKFLRGLAGVKGLFSTEGAEWQAQRSWFSPAFSLSNVSTLVARMAEETLVFKEKLTELAMSGGTFSMLEVVTPLTVDTTVRSVCDIRLRSQTQQSQLAQGFHSAISWLAGDFDGIVKQWAGPVMMDWYMLKLDKLLKEVIKERYAVRADNKPKKSSLI
jgi:cytochrome P450